MVTAGGARRPDGDRPAGATIVTRADVMLPGALAVVPSAKATEQLQWAPTALVTEFSELAARGALPARMDLDRGQLILYTRRYVAFLYPTKFGDGYSLGHVSRRSFRDEDKLSRGALILHCRAPWGAFNDVRDIPRPQGTLSPRWASHWDQLSLEWTSLGRVVDGASELPPHHRDYLALLDHVVEASRDIELAKLSGIPEAPYREVEPTREERYSGRGVYSFSLARPPRGLPVGALVEVAECGDPPMRGKVVRSGGRTLVVRFERTVDFQRIPPQGRLRASVSDRVFQAQRDAIETLAKGEAANPALLSVLVDGRYARYQPDLSRQPVRQLDEHQADAFRRALAVPDVLLVLGPPGTGKTTTIVEIVTALVALGQRVLVTSHTNRAVDNVVENLPPQINSVRVGAEDSMTSAARRRGLDTLTEQVRAGIRDAAEPRGQLTEFRQSRAVFDQWLGHLRNSLAAVDAAEAALVSVEQAVDHAVQALSPQLAADRRSAADRRTRQLGSVIRLREELARRREVLARRAKTTPSDSPEEFWRLVTRFRRWLLARARRREQGAREALVTAQQDLTEAEAAVEALSAQAVALIAGDPEHRPLLAERERQIAARDGGHGGLRRTAEVVRGGLREVLPALPTLAALDDEPADSAGWVRFHDWAVESFATVGQRADLLGHWHDQLASAETELQRELVRYADVVAATCIGTATSKVLSDTVFDVALIDEAGQISTPNLLVPMVRARRAVLVGDQHQLPPFLDEEVRGWAAGLKKDGRYTPEAVTRVNGLLRASGFELLVPGAAATRANYVELNLQRRMPEQVARFVSDAFYAGRLGTRHGGGRDDPLFRSAFAMIDTSDRPAGERGETALKATETRHEQGYVNALEVELIVSLLARAAGWYRDWAVIVPYKAQARRISEALAGEFGDPTTVADNVGTVDSFQGGERDLIIYGFTRSNSRNSVGFLTELRRLNVAVSRAKQQLVMVGDLATLRSATDTEFRKKISMMEDHLRRDGDLRLSCEIEKLLRDPR
ncbi:conserved hypothetical protein [Parafrankia sp. EAN1pec]|uniref:DEAD/DEAH box helicase n=1 Tax=Parafrankia sp. (strain EAN1pec) TaxID=298653 RepID=UPI00005402FD|nr:conserved hypothetical protein [Frankia sp. EAN1pec]